METKHTTAVSKPTLKQPEKKLSPMEKLKLKMRAAFDGQSKFFGMTHAQSMQQNQVLIIKL